MSRLPTKLECPGTRSGAEGRCELEVAPGEEVRCRLLVYNAADKVDEVHVRWSGPLAEWVRVEPDRLTLMPETQGVLELVLGLPADARVPAVRHPILVEIRSGLPETEPSIEECAVDVVRVTDAQISVLPRPAGQGDTWYEVVIDSRANHPLHLELDAAAPVDVMIPRPVLEALWLLFGYAGCRVMARKGRSRWGGWLFGLLLGPVGLVIAAVLPDADVQPRGGRL